jgi:predicted nucleic acid-binding protein
VPLAEEEQRVDNALLLDTSVVSIFLKPSSVHAMRLQKLQRKLTDKSLYISLVTVAELLFWAAKRSWGEKRRTQLDNHLHVFGVLAPTRATAEIWAVTKSVCETHGVPVAPHDLWIASAALEFDIPILTADNDFRHIPDVSVITS